MRYQRLAGDKFKGTLSFSLYVVGERFNVKVEQLEIIDSVLTTLLDPLLYLCVLSEELPTMACFDFM